MINLYIIILLCIAAGIVITILTTDYLSDILEYFLKGLIIVCLAIAIGLLVHYYQEIYWFQFLITLGFVIAAVILPIFETNENEQRGFGILLIVIALIYGYFYLQPMTEIEDAIEDGKLVRFNELVVKKNIDKAPIATRNRLLYLAIDHKRVKIAKKLIKLGVNLNPTEKSNQTAELPEDYFPLENAVKNHQLPMVELLLHYKADPNRVESRLQETVLHDAARWRKYQIMKILLENGANPNVVNTFGETPIFMVYKYDSNEKPNYRLSMQLTNLLIKYGANLNDKNLIKLAVKSNNIKLIDKLIEEKVSFKQIEPNGDNLLHIAVLYSSAEVLEKLLEQGIDVNHRNEYHQTPLRTLRYYRYAAQLQGYPSPHAFKVEKDKMEELLTAKGALMSTKDEADLKHAVLLSHGCTSYNFVESSARIMFQPFPSSIPVSMMEKEVAQSINGVSYARIYTPVEKTIVDKKVNWIPKTSTSEREVLWINHADLHPVILKFQSGAISHQLKIPPRSLTSIKLTRGIWNVTLLTRPQKTEKLNINTRQSAFFVYTSGLSDLVCHQTKLYK